MFQFEAQTGRVLPFHQVITVDLPPSNFYRYVFYDEHLDWVQKTVDAASLDSTGYLQYPYLTLQAFANRDLRPALDRGRTIWE